MLVTKSVNDGLGRPLNHCRLFESRDIDETRERISQVMQPHKLVPLRRLTMSPMYMDYLPLRKMGIGAIGLGRSHVDVGTVGDYHLIICCTAGSARITRDTGEIDIGANSGVCLAPGERFAGDFSEDCEQLVLRIDATSFDAHAGQRNSRLLPDFRLDNAGLRPWVGLMSTILNDRTTSELIKQEERIAADYEQLLIGLLINGQRLEAPTTRTTVAPACVKRAESFMHEHYARPLKLEDIATAADVPPRTLIDAFGRFRGTSPMRRLREIRLGKARSILLSEDGSANVAAAALDAGFAHFGRFAKEYQSRFGELPSQTRERALRKL